MISYGEAMRLVAEALAAESGCAPKDFSAASVLVCTRPDVPNRSLVRRYRAYEPVFGAVSLGHGAVVFGSRAIVLKLQRIFAGTGRDQVFEVARLAAVEQILTPYGLRLLGPFPRLVCGADTWRERLPPSGIAVTIEPAPSDDRLRALGAARWPNAISEHPQNPQTGLALARHEDAVVGVSATGADSERLWGIGIDVAEPYRGRGIGPALASVLARHVLAEGAVPWWGAAPANLASIHTALAAGFRLGWLEAYSGPAASAP